MVSVFLEVDDETNASTDNFFKEISTNIPRRKSTEKVNLDLPNDFSLKKLLPRLKSFYNYKNKIFYMMHHVIFTNVYTNIFTNTMSILRKC